MMQKPKADLVLSQFSLLYDCPDVQQAIAECWPLMVAENSTLETKIDTLTKSLQRIYTLVYVPGLEFENAYPTRTSYGVLAQSRSQELKRVLLTEKPALVEKLGKSLLQTVKDEIVFFEEYKPFTINELDTVSRQLGQNKDTERQQDELENLYAKLGLKL